MRATAVGGGSKFSGLFNSIAAPSAFLMVFVFLLLLQMSVSSGSGSGEAQQIHRTQLEVFQNGETDPEPEPEIDTEPSAFLVSPQTTLMAMALTPTPAFLFPTPDGQPLLTTMVPGVLVGAQISFPPPTATPNSVRFYLYTPGNPEIGEELMMGADWLLENSAYVVGAPLKIILHGFARSAMSGHGPRLKSAYLEGGRVVNVVIIDWEPMASIPWYAVAAANSKIVGETTGQFILYLVDRSLVRLEDVHIVGHSLGAHAAGFAGRYVGAGRIGRITALDPAAPLFKLVDDSQRIDPSDAAFVDVIHTGAGIIALKEPRGHVDFYPNGGKIQPGCGFDFIGRCKHRRGNFYMAESINNPNSFQACKCKSWSSYALGNCDCVQTAHMGEYVSRSARGIYFLRTNSKEPWSR